MVTGMTSKSTLVSSVSTEIESTLLGSAIAVGDKLPSERELAARMGVSRPVIREALQQLQERGLVEANPAAARTTGQRSPPTQPTH